MADEGIMALPQGTGMQGEQPPVQQQAVTSADSYDAAQTALGRVNPRGQAALKEALRQNIGNLQLTPQQLDALIQVFEYVSQHPGDYKNLLQKMLEAGVLDEGDMPPEYDPEFIGAMLAVLNEMQQMQAAGAQEPMDLSPVVQGLQPMGMASGGLADIGQYLASKGRGGDSMLAHINPEEAAMLKRRGGSGTINPNTGLPEFKEGALGGVFDAIGGALKGVANVAKDLLKSPVGRILGTIALATVLGPAGVGLSMGVAGGLAGAGTSLLAGGSVKEALVSGAMGYIGGGGTVMGVNPVAAVGGYLPGAAGTGIGAAGGALNTGLATGLIGAGIGKLSGMSTEDALQMGLTSGVSAGALRAFGADDYAIKSKMLALHEAGDPSALSLYDTGNVANMKAYIDAKASPFSTAQPNPVTAPAQSSPFQGAQPAPVPGQTPVLGAAAQTGPADFYSKLAPGELSNSPYQSSLRSMPAAPVAEPPGFFDKALTGAGRMYDTYLSPDRTGLPSDVSFFRKYGPLAAAGTATIAAFGGMDSSPAEIDPITAGERARYAESRLRAKARRDRIEKGGYGLEGNRPLIYAADGGIMTANKVRHLYEGGDAGYGGETGGGANAPGTGGNISGGDGAFSGFGRDANERAYEAIDRDNIATLEANRALTAQENNMRDAQNLAAYSAFDRDRSARYAAEADAATIAKSNNDNPNPSGFANFAGSFYEGADGRAKGGYIGRFNNGGYIQRFVAGSDADGVLSNDERRRLAQERRRGYGLEGNLLSQAKKGNLLDTALDQTRTGNTARPFEEYFVNNSGDQRGPEIDNNGGPSNYDYGGSSFGAPGSRQSNTGFFSGLLGRTDQMPASVEDRGGFPVGKVDFNAGELSGRQPTALSELDAARNAVVGNLSNQTAASARASEIASLGGGARSLVGGIASLGGGSIDAVENAIAQEISNAKMEAAAMKAADNARFGTNSAMPASVQAAQDAANRAGIAEANLGGYGQGSNTGDFLGGSDSFGEGQYAKGGPAKMTHFPRRDGPINGPGTGTSDDIPAMLSDGEFVFTAKAVRNAGGGSRRKGAARMYKLMKKLEGGAVKGN